MRIILAVTISILLFACDPPPLTPTPRPDYAPQATELVVLSATHEVLATDYACLMDQLWYCQATLYHLTPTFLPTVTKTPSPVITVTPTKKPTDTPAPTASPTLTATPSEPLCRPCSWQAPCPTGYVCSNCGTTLGMWCVRYDYVREDCQRCILKLFVWNAEAW